MSHIFISYSSKNITEREQLCAFLLENGFASDEIWFDKERIDAGEIWHEQIDKALETAFAVIIVVTSDSMRSTYVTYEWAWAISRKIPVVPIVFGRKPRNLHRKLGHDIHYINLVPEQTDKLLANLNNLKRETPLFKYAQITILKKCSSAIIWASASIHFFKYSLIWINGNYIVTGDNLKYLWEKSYREVENLYSVTLPEFWLNSSHALTIRQKYQIEKLVDHIEKLHLYLGKIFVDILNRSWISYDYEQRIYDDPDPRRKSIEEIAKFWEGDVIPLLNFFDSNNFYLMMNEYFKLIGDGSLTYSDNLEYYFPVKNEFMKLLPEKDKDIIFDCLERIVQYLDLENKAIQNK